MTIVIDMIAVQNLLAPFCYVLAKDILRHFVLLGSHSKQFYILVISLHKKIKKLNKIFQPESNILTCLKINRDKLLEGCLRVQKINRDENKKLSWKQSHLVH